MFEAQDQIGGNAITADMPQAVATISAYLIQLNTIVFPVIIGFTAIGLIMKWYGWPRPPLILGFVLGPIIEENLFSSISVHGLRETFFRPLTVGLLILVITFSVGLTVAMNRSGRAEGSVPSGASPSERSAGGGAVSAVMGTIAQRVLRPAWRVEMLVPLVLIAVGAYAWQESLGFPGKSNLFPLGTSVGLVVFSVAELLKQGLGTPPRGPADIMDMPMLSRGAIGAKRSRFIVAGLLLLFFGGSALIGVRWAAMLFAVLTPIFLLEGRQRWIASPIALLFVAAFLGGMTDYVMNIKWPDSLVSPWLPWGAFVHNT